MKALFLFSMRKQRKAHANSPCAARRTSNDGKPRRKSARSPQDEQGRKARQTQPRLSPQPPTFHVASTHRRRLDHQPYPRFIELCGVPTSFVQRTALPFVFFGSFRDLRFCMSFPESLVAFSIFARASWIALLTAGISSFIRLAINSSGSLA